MSAVRLWPLIHDTRWAPRAAILRLQRAIDCDVGNQLIPYGDGYMDRRQHRERPTETAAPRPWCAFGHSTGVIPRP